MVSQLADIEYFHLCKELNKRMVNSRINKIYQVGENIFKINFNSSAEVGEGKISLVVDLPNYLTITNKFISTPEKPSAFVMNLRKYVDNARVISIEQPSLERILIFNLYAQGNEMKLVFEMFSKGNVLLINSNNKIVFTYRKEIWKDREIKKNLDYVLPPSKKSCLEVTEDDLELKGKKNIMSGILSNISLAPKYLEYIILSEGENPRGEFLSKESIPKIITKIKSLSEINSFYVYEDNENKELSILDMKKENVKEFNSITEAIDYAFELTVQKKVKKEKSIEVEKHISRQLEENKKELDSTIKKAEFIYENYNKVEYVLKYVNSLLDKGMSEKEINEILEKSNMSVDLKEKKVKIKIKL
jgi:predicted ribosome quality control (RQC) complex YloA/Tae2 family protein